MDAFEVEVSFSDEDVVEHEEAAVLAHELEAVGAHGQVLDEHPPGTGMLEVAAIVALIGVSVASTAALSVVAAFIYRVFHKGVILDLTGPRPRIQKSDDLPKGTLLIMNKDGTTNLHQGLSSETVGDVMKDAIAMGTAA